MFRRVVMTLAILALLTPCAAVADPPAESGPYVVRYEDSSLAGWLVVDAKRGYFSVIGVDIYELCTTGGGFNILSVQAVQNPQNENQLNVIVKMDDAYAGVWMLPSGPTTVCDYILTTQPVGIGTVDGNYTDNDLFANLSPDEERTNTWTLSAHGVIMNESDESFNLNTGFHCVWRDRTDFNSVVCKDKVIVR